MPGELKYYHSDLTNIRCSGVCYIIEINKETTIVIKKDELNGITMKDQDLTMYFKNFPSIFTRIPHNNMAMREKFSEFIKRELIKEHLNDI